MTSTRFNKRPFVNQMARTGQPRWLKAPPTTPPDSPLFAEQMDEVLAVCTEAKTSYPYAFMAKHALPTTVPGPLEEHILDDNGQPSGPKAARLVRMDHPFSLMLFILRWLTRTNTTYRMPWKYGWATVGGVDFIGAQIYAPLYIAWQLRSTIVVIFKMKWADWVIRPEEWFGRNMTHYTEGCPGHPGDPAGHGGLAGATAAAFLQLFSKPHITDLSTFQKSTIVYSCLMFASFRTFAGVHRHIENIRGFIIGWAVVRRISFHEAAREIEQIAPGSTRVATAA